MGVTRHSHIAAKGYLKAWTEDGVLGVGWGNREGPTRLPPSAVAVRSRFYLDQDADGSANDWFETQMGRVESKAIKALRQLETEWPIDASARAQRVPGSPVPSVPRPPPLVRRGDPECH